MQVGANVYEKLVIRAEHPEGERDGEIPSGAELIQGGVREGAGGTVPLVRLEMVQPAGKLPPPPLLGWRQLVSDEALKDVIDAFRLGKRAQPFLKRRLCHPTHLGRVER